MFVITANGFADPIIVEKFDPNLYGNIKGVLSSHAGICNLR
jgi:hypothetical protein